MNYDAHIAKYNGKYLADYGGQCVSNAAHYCLDNGKPIAYANACDWWNHPSLTGAFNFVANNPSDYKQVPARGNIIIWNSALAGSGGAGHIAIFDSAVSPGVFRSFDANWGGAACHFVTHNWNNVIGWMVPKTSIPAPSTGGTILNQGEVEALYRLALHRNGDAGGVKNYTGKSFSTIYNDMIGSQEWLTQNHQLLVGLPDAQSQINNLTATINALNQQITDITGQNNATKADKDAALVKIAELTTQLSDAMDKLKEAQNKPTVPIQPENSIVIDKDTLWDKIKNWLSIFTKKG